MSRSAVHESAYSCCPVALSEGGLGASTVNKTPEVGPDDANMVGWQKNTGTNGRPLTIDLHSLRERGVRVRVIESQQEPEQVRDKSSK